MFVAVRWNPVHFVVRSHDGLYMAFFHRGFKRLQPILAYHALGIIGGPNVGPAFGLTMHGKVFRGRHHMRLVDTRPISLKSLDRSHSKARNEIRILPISLFRPSPARIASEVQHRRKTRSEE